MYSKEINDGRGKSSTDGVRHCSRSTIGCVSTDAALQKMGNFVSNRGEPCLTGELELQEPLV